MSEEGAGTRQKAGIRAYSNRFTPPTRSPRSSRSATRCRGRCRAPGRSPGAPRADRPDESSGCPDGRLGSPMSRSPTTPAAPRSPIENAGGSLPQTMTAASACLTRSSRPRAARAASPRSPGYNERAEELERLRVGARGPRVLRAGSTRRTRSGPCTAPHPPRRSAPTRGGASGARRCRRALVAPVDGHRPAPEAAEAAV